MNTTVEILGSLGGLVAFVVAVVAVFRGVFGQVQATRDLTAAVRELRMAITQLDGKVDGHAERISRLEGVTRRLEGGRAR